MFSDENYVEFKELAKKQFTPFRPITLVELFKGRIDIVHRITNELDNPGRHIIVYGDRGVGKTSLANLISFFCSFRDDDTILHRCQRSTTFDTICVDVLRRLGVTHVPVSKTVEKDARLEMSIPPLSVGVGATTSDEYKTLDSYAFSPNCISDLLQDRKKLIILDEYDRIESNATNVAMADLIKQLSDSDSEARIVIVGVSESVGTLIGNHASISRNLAQVHLKRMEPKELRPILADGFRNLGVNCTDDIIDCIVGTADGFPHFAHLLGLKISDVIADRLVEAEDKPEVAGENVEPCVTLEDFRLALEHAIEGTQESLRLAYIKATETVRKKSDGYVQVLEGMAIADQTEVQINDLLTNINELFDTKYKQQSISNWLGVLVNDRGVLLRPRVGFYKFADPMMRAYVRMIMGEKRIVGEQKYQKLLPFMCIGEVEGLLPAPPTKQI